MCRERDGWSTYRDRDREIVEANAMILFSDFSFHCFLLCGPNIPSCNEYTHIHEMRLINYTLTLLINLYD